MKGYGYYSRQHQVAGFANCILIANAGFDIILVAKYPLSNRIEVSVN